MPYGAQTLWPDHCVEGSPGAEFHRDRPDASELVIRKGFRPAIDSYSAFFENDRTTPTGLAGYLRERGFGRVVCVGLALDYCVRYTASRTRAGSASTARHRGGCRAIDLDGSLRAAYEAFAATGVEVR